MEIFGKFIVCYMLHWLFLSSYLNLPSGTSLRKFWNQWQILTSKIEWWSWFIMYCDQMSNIFYNNSFFQWLKAAIIVAHMQVYQHSTNFHAILKLKNLLSLIPDVLHSVSYKIFLASLFKSFQDLCIWAVSCSG